jgi:hypothetical protein
MLVVALADFDGNDDQLQLSSGETYIVLIKDYGNGWSYGCSLDFSQKGVFPETFVKQQAAP